MDRVVGGRNGSLTALALAALFIGTLAAPVGAQTYSIVELQGVAQRINDNGQVAGWVYVGPDAHAAIYSGGAWQDLGVPAGDQLSALFGINASGAAVGYSFVSLPGPDNRWQAIWAPAGSSSVQALSVIAPDSFAYAINDAGAIVGCLNRYDDIFPDPHRAFLYQNGSLSELHTLLVSNPTLDFSCARDINNAGQVVGEVQPSSAPQRGFLYQNGTATLLAQSATAYLSNAKAISNTGTIVGEGRLPGFTADHALAYNVATGTITSLGLEATGAYNSRPNDVNSQGDVVGMMFLGVGEHAFLASGGQVLDLNDLLPTGSDWVLQEAVSINDSGQIVGRGYLASSPTVTRYFLMDATQTPGSAIDGLIAQVRALQADGSINKGNATALVAKLQEANKHLLGRCSRLAVQSLEVFVNQVDVLIRTHRLSAAKGELLIDEANRIIDDLLSGGHSCKPKPKPKPKQPAKKCAHHSNAKGHRCR
jgi:probable HAF family extracellular repeat protein